MQAKWSCEVAVNMIERIFSLVVTLFGRLVYWQGFMTVFGLVLRHRGMYICYPITRPQ